MSHSTVTSALASSLLPNLGVDLAFELGWDHAHHGVTPLVSTLQAWPQLAQGFEAGRQTFGLRTLQATRHARKWLRVRLHALERGRVFDTEQVTPRFLQLIDVDHCPITRVALSHHTGLPSDASLDRVFNDAAYAAGNLVVMSVRANEAKSDHGFEAALQCMRDCEEGVSEIDGLGRAEWARIAVLSSFVRPLDHAQAATLPMLVLPPNRLRVFNPIQALQAVVCRLLLGAEQDPMPKLQALQQQLPGKSLRHDFEAFSLAFVAQVRALHRDRGPQPLRWSVEDAWQTRLVLNRWKRVARQLTPAQAEAMVQAQDGQGVRTLSDGQATEGWALATRGLLSPRPVPRLLADPRVALPSSWLAASQRELFATPH